MIVIMKLKHIEHMNYEYTCIQKLYEYKYD